MDLLGNYRSDTDEDTTDKDELESPKKLSTESKSDADEDRCCGDKEQQLESPKRLST
jgi:hypothetical protein